MISGGEVGSVAVSAITGALFSATEAVAADVNVGAISVLVTEMSSTPIHSSLLRESVVMTRICRSATLFHAGSDTETLLTAFASVGPVDASAMKPAGTLVNAPVPPI